MVLVPQVRLLVLLTACAVLYGCSDTTDPRSVIDATLAITDVEFEDGATTVRIASGTAENSGNQTFLYPLNCLYPVAMSIIDESGAELLVRDPNLLPDCPPGVCSLQPGEKIGSQVSLTWAWTEAGARYQIPAGTYTVRAHFVYYKSEDSEPRKVEEELVVVID